MNFNDYLQLSTKYDVIPLKQTFVLDTVTPISAVKALAEAHEEFFLLESAAGQEHLGRFSFLGLKPFSVFSSKEGINRITGKFAQENTLSPFEALQNFYDSLNIYNKDAGPFSGGGAGYFGYDSVRYIEDIPLKTGEMPDAMFLFPSIIVCFDHLKHEVTCTIFTFPDQQPQQAFEEGKKQLEEIKNKLETSAVIEQVDEAKQAKLMLEPTDDKYIKAVEKAQEHITAGDIFQIVLSKNFEVPFAADPFAAYRKLRTVNPSPYLFFFQFKDFYLFGSSPEMLVKKEGDKVVTYPIAGTRRKTGEAVQDRLAEMELLADIKEKAEHVMLVDLGRNDLGKICVPGSVKVKEFMDVQKFSHVMHLVSVVEGLCKRGITAIDVLKAVFPAGTVSGAPKVRAMEIISELEGDSRGLYAGAVGYMDFSGNCDFCITIRTIIVKDEVAHIRAGAGVVADSVPEKEYAEVLAKAKVLFETIRG